MSDVQPARLRLARSRVEFTDVEGEIVALDLERSVYLALSGTGALLWRLLYDGASPEELCRTLISTYSIDASLAEADVGAFLGELESVGLIEQAKAPGTPAGHVE
jgi:Coenzyme PQQ synthesis protein D (PqqD)